MMIDSSFVRSFVTTILRYLGMWRFNVVLFTILKFRLDVVFERDADGVWGVATNVGFHARA